MVEHPPPRPTDAELSILRVLWTLGPSTVRDVHEQLNRRAPTGYTTVLKLLQIMTEKGLVVRDETERAHIYEARHSEQQTPPSVDPPPSSCCRRCPGERRVPRS